ncbi:SDR family oxidoreductase [Sporolactobacillus laevolacticus]|uniref:Short-chain dehydrogenase n=1 Tax=Sporolactobacillus laevolacticus DSM 442 TaxID=1395513 RepID=V6J949_9BACL|nr:SDR family oxidoreductase [Sporolactobacillus laevolacticus]EST13309.1 short-chain dehydrogenase [Sporolactobacillus laevolacticus DSM 442]
MKNERVVIIGGSSGIGFEIAKLAVQKEAEVIIAGRTINKLKAAQKQLGNVTYYSLDVEDEAAVKDFFAKIGEINHLAVPAAKTGGGKFLETETITARQLFDNKFWGQYYAAKYGAPNIRKGGSIVLFSGVVAFKHMIGASALGALNAAIANLGQTLALELAPIRVNVISPGIIDTPARASMNESDRAAYYQNVAAQLPVERVGLPEDVAKSAIHAMENGFMTGNIIHVDGGHHLI